MSTDDRVETVSDRKMLPVRLNRFDESAPSVRNIRE